MTKTCVILGAGATKYVNAGAWADDPGWDPPLADELFLRAASQPRYRTILNLYPGAAHIVMNIHSQMQDDSSPFSFEDTLSTYATNTNDEIRALFTQIPAYIRQIIATMQAAFTSSPANYAVLLQRLVFDASRDVLFLTLNYDTYLELAISNITGATSFQSMPDYLRVHERMRVVKIHGSINWGWPLPDSNMPGGADEERLTQAWQSQMLRLGELDTSTMGEPIVLAGSESNAGGMYRYVSPPKDAVTSHRGHYEAVYPAVTAPLAGEGSGAFLCPKSHVSAAQAFLRECREYVIVGTSLVDDDLLGLLKDNVKGVSRLVVVDPDYENVLERLRERADVFKHFRDAYIVQGFTQFVRGSGPMDMGGVFGTEL